MRQNARAHALNCQDCGLQKLCFPPSFSEDALERVSSIIGQPPVSPRQQRIYGPGDPADTLYAVRSGAVKTSLLTADGREIVTGFYLPGEVLGLENLGQTHCLGSAITLAPTSLCALPVTSVSLLSRQLPELQGHLFQMMSADRRADYQRLHLLTHADADTRLAAFLVGMAARLARRRLPGDHLHLPMSRADLGNHLGLALETVSRALGRLTEKGLITVSGKRIDILDDVRLQAAASAQCA